MEKTDFTWKIGGEAGFGIASSGHLFAKAMNRLNYFIYGYLEYPSLIRGGHNVYELHVSNEKVYSQEKKVDMLVCLNSETYDLHQHELKAGAVVIYDPEETQINGKVEGVHFYEVPVKKMLTELGGKPVMKNNLFMGVSIGFLKAGKEEAFEILQELFGNKGEEIVKMNERMIQAGIDFVESHPLSEFKIRLEKQPNKNDLVLTGNEAIALGTIAADCRLYAAYPMTPATSILHVLAGYADKTKMVVKHVGDEIEAINMVVGSALTGVRSMTASSGGGFALMNEGLGLAGVTESALVICVSQRPGPASGVPTWQGQGDLHYLIHASQDEFPRIILAPGDPEEAFYLTMEAFNLADKYQTPVFIVVDKYLSEGPASTPKFDLTRVSKERGKIVRDTDLNPGQKFMRYALTEDGISPRSLPGQKGGEFLCNSYEHSPDGLATEDPKEIVDQKDKRQKKVQTYLNHDFVMPEIYGEEEAKLTLIAWGSTKQPVLEALRDLPNVNYYHFNHVFPLHKEKISALLAKTKKTLLLEENGTAQFGSVLKELSCFEPTETMLRYDGRPFYPEDIREKVKSMLS